MADGTSNVVWGWHDLRSGKAERFAADVVDEIHRVFLDGFGLALGWSSEGIQRTLRQSTFVGVATVPGAVHYCGYAFYLVPDALLEDAYVLWENAICLRKELQNHGLARKAINEARRLWNEGSPERTIGWVGGRTQNPQIMRRYAKFGPTFPFDRSYASPEGRQVMGFLRTHVPEVGGAACLEQDTGICRRVYGERRLGDYPVDPAFAVPGFERQLSEWGFDRDAGDAIVMVAKLKQPQGLAPADGPRGARADETSRRVR